MNAIDNDTDIDEGTDNAALPHASDGFYYPLPLTPDAISRIFGDEAEADGVDTKATAPVTPPAAPAVPAAPIPPTVGAFNYVGDAVSDAFIAYPELVAAWGYRTSGCGHGGVHRLSVLDPFEDGERTLTAWVVRVSPKTGDVWVRHLTADGGKLGRDRVHATLLAAKSYVEKEAADEFGPSADVIRGCMDGDAPGVQSGVAG